MTLQSFIVFLILSLLSCNSSQTKTNAEALTSGNKADVKDTMTKFISKDTILITDTIPRFTVGDYSVTYEMMAEQKADNSSSYKKIRGKTQSLDKAWFTNTH